MIQPGAFGSVFACASLVLGGIAASACGSSGAAPSGPTDAQRQCTPDESAPVPADRCTTSASDTTKPLCNTWLKVEIPGTVCGDGSQYKFFVNWSSTSNNLLVSFEPGGACWDYESCSGTGGVRGAANPNGIPDDHMSVYQYLNLLRRSTDNPAQHYNMVFVPYCTGDTHTGNNVITYTSTGAAGDGGAGSLTRWLTG